MTLSGGQKARVALARALYSEAQVSKDLECRVFAKAFFS